MCHSSVFFKLAMTTSFKEVGVGGEAESEEEIISSVEATVDEEASVEGIAAVE